MGGRNLHNEPFDESTLTKLDLYRRYVRAWLPVFLNAPKLVVDRIQIFDFFAGPGQDEKGVSGSPLIALEEIDLALKNDHRNNPEIHLYLNEFMRKKFENLKTVCTASHFTANVHIHFLNEDFPVAFRTWQAEFQNNQGSRFKTANLLFLDQNGTKQISKEVFLNIVSAERTDFLFFVSSSYINRFKTQPQNSAGTPLEGCDLSGMTTKTSHRILCDAYKEKWLPKGYEYYIAPFALAKDNGSNVYGLIFGSGHPAGIDRFLKICWEEDEIAGAANFDIDNEQIVPNQMTFWESINIPNKLQVFERHLKEKVLAKVLRTNIDVYKYALAEACRASHAKAVLERMVAEKELPKQSFSVSYSSCGLRGSIPKPIRFFER